MEKLGKTTNALNWFEIPVTDVERAKKFYESYRTSEASRRQNFIFC